MAPLPCVQVNKDLERFWGLEIENEYFQNQLTKVKNNEEKYWSFILYINFEKNLEIHNI